MIITVNGKKQEVENNISLNELLLKQDVKMLQYVSVQINEEVILRENFESTLINENDTIEFLYFMGGGSL